MLGAIVYLLFFSVILGIAALVMIKTLRQNQFPPDSDDDGGIGGGGDFPVIDLPPGGKIEDILVDRWHGDVVKGKTVKI